MEARRRLRRLSTPFFFRSTRTRIMKKYECKKDAFHLNGEIAFQKGKQYEYIKTMGNTVFLRKENISRVESESVGHLGIDRIEIQLEDGILKNEFEIIFNASNWSEKKELKKISK